MKKTILSFLVLLSLSISASSCVYRKQTASLASSSDEIYRYYERYLDNGGSLAYEEWLETIQKNVAADDSKADYENACNQDITNRHFLNLQSKIQIDGTIVEDGEWMSFFYKLENVSLISEVKAFSWNTTENLCLAFYSSEWLFDSSTFLGGTLFVEANKVNTIESIPVPKNSKVAVLSAFWSASTDYRFSVRFSNIDAKELDDIDYLTDMTTKKPNMKFGAHQGYRGVAPANTIPAFRLAGIYGWDYLWLAQVKHSLDGTWYVIHDGVIDGCTDGSGNIHRLTDEYLSTVHVNTGVNIDQFSQEELRIPTLEETIQICNLYGMGACFRITDMPLSYETDDQMQLWDSFISLVRAYKKEGEIFSADTVDCLELLREVSGENWEACLFLGNEATYEDYINAFDESNLNGNLSVLLHKDQVTLNAVKELHLRNIKVYGFSNVDMSDVEICNWAKWGVDICQNGYKNRVERYF